MTNWEKYKDEIIEAKKNRSLYHYVENHKEEIGVNFFASNGLEPLYFVVWLMEEYQEPEVDWIKVEVDTLCLVKGNNSDWVYRYFAMYDSSTGTPRFWADGKTSFTKSDDYDYSEWSYYRLAEVEE